MFILPFYLGRFILFYFILYLFQFLNGDEPIVVKSKHFKESLFANLNPNWLSKNIGKERKFDVRFSDHKSYEFWFRADTKPVKANDFKAFHIVQMGMHGINFDFFCFVCSFFLFLLFKKDFISNLSSTNVPPVYLFTNFGEMGPNCDGFQKEYVENFCLKDIPEKGFPRV
jgi:hypothetical protein